jgi:DNA polymerase I-like protein with 3'-5' exonuclease and polymerase domains
MSFNNMQLPLWKPQHAWRPTPVSQMPSWADAKRIAIDIETYDPQLRDLGPGVRRGGYIVGISFKIEDGPGHYLPVRHFEDNLPSDQVYGYLREQAKHFKGDLVGANITYDLDYLFEQKVLFPQVRRFRDVQVADPLINELHMSYSLENIATRYGLPGKDERMLKEGAAAYGVDPKKGLYKLPGRYVGDYAIQDVALPLMVLRRQERLIEEHGLEQIYDLETRLTPVLLKMRRRGVAIDLGHLQKVEDWSIQEQTAALEKVRELTGVRLALEDVNKPQALVPALKQIGCDIPKTSQGKPSVQKDWLRGLKHPIADALNRARKMDKLRGTFCRSIRAHLVNGRIHATFNQMRRSSDSDLDDDTGARYGRLSCTDPNLQQQPARDPEIGKFWRKIYIPDDGMLWAAMDYSQQEPRITYHYAFASKCAGAEVIVKRFNDDLSADSHTEMARICWSAAEIEANFKQLRGYAKEIFLGVTYGMGGAKLCKKLGKPTIWKFSDRLKKQIEVAGPEGQAILDTVDKRMPFLRELARKCENRAKSTGKIKTLLGRLCHFPLKDDGQVDWAHKALNRLVQGSAADQTKLAVVTCDDLGLDLQLQVHDEIDTSVNSPEHAEQIANVMRTCVQLAVPSKVDVEIGKSWGDSM